MAFELLRMVYEGVTFKLSHPAWDGWFVEAKSGKLVSPDRGGLSFQPHELSYIRDVYRRMGIAEAHNVRLAADIAQLQTENAELRELVASGVLGELHSVRNQIDAMLDKFNPAKVYQFPSNQPNQIRKVASA